MSKPLYILRAERARAVEELFEQLSWYCDAEELRENLDHVECCDEGSHRAQAKIEGDITERDRRTRGQLLLLWANVIDAVKAVYDAERQEVAELIASHGRAA